MITGARAKAWCLLIHADASLSLSLSLSDLRKWASVRPCQVPTSPPTASCHHRDRRHFPRGLTAPTTPRGQPRYAQRPTRGPPPRHLRALPHCKPTRRGGTPHTLESHSQLRAKIESGLNHIIVLKAEIKRGQYGFRLHSQRPDQHAHRVDNGGGGDPHGAPGGRGGDVRAVLQGRWGMLKLKAKFESSLSCLSFKR